MNEFATMMKNADTLTAIATIQMHVRCTSRGSRLQPKIHKPMKVDSKKNAAKSFHRQRRAEDVADEPGVLAPIHAELELLHDPGGHSDGEVDQEQLAEELGESIPGALSVTTHTVCMTAISGARPMVSGTKMKW